MNNKQVAIGLFIISGVMMLIGLAIYNENASNVNAIKQSPMSGLLGSDIKPATPTTTIICVIIGIGAAIGGVAALNTKK